MEQKGAVNGYKCECGYVIYTINRKDGTTPFMIGCRRQGCDKSMRSLFYRVIKSVAKGLADYEWIGFDTVEEMIAFHADEIEESVRFILDREDMTEEEARQIAQRGLIDHHENGGLFLRKFR